MFIEIFLIFIVSVSILEFFIKNTNNLDNHIRYINCLLIIFILLDSIHNINLLTYKIIFILCLVYLIFFLMHLIKKHYTTKIH